MADAIANVVDTFKGMNAEDKSALLVKLISEMSVVEVVKSVKTMEEEFGVSAQAPVFAAAPAQAGGGAEAAAQAQTEFKVVMTDFGANKVGVIKVVREATSLGLKEAKDLVEGIPATIKEGLSKEDADKLVKSLTEAGAKAELK